MRKSVFINKLSEGILRHRNWERYIEETKMLQFGSSLFCRGKEVVGGGVAGHVEYFGFFQRTVKGLGEIAEVFLKSSSCWDGAWIEDTSDSLKGTKEVETRGTVLGRGGKSRDDWFYSEGEHGLTKVGRCSEMKSSGNFWGRGATIARSGFPSPFSLNPFRDLFLSSCEQPHFKRAPRALKRPRNVLVLAFMVPLC